VGVQVFVTFLRLAPHEGRDLFVTWIVLQNRDATDHGIGQRVASKADITEGNDGAVEFEGLGLLLDGIGYWPREPRFPAQGREQNLKRGPLVEQAPNVV
jgi:hypothetical protein